MKFKTAILITLLCPLASHALVGGAMRGLKVDDCSKRTNSLGSQMSDLQSLVHKVALVGEESGRVVSDDPKTLEARVAESSGYGLICGIDVGTLNIFEHNGKTLLVGTAHGFYSDGKPRCDQSSGEFFPDDHYDTNPNIDHKKSFKFKLPPLNDAQALKTSLDVRSNEKLKDLIVLEVENPEELLSINGRQRMVKKISNFKNDELLDVSRQSEVTLIGGRGNFQNFSKVPVERGCHFYPAKPDLQVMKHNCDTGGGSSGASLDLIRENRITSLGIHYGGVHVKGKINPKRIDRSSLGNYFIPSSAVKKVLDEVTLNLPTN